MDRVSQALFSVVATYNDTFFLSFHISVNDLRRLIEKAGGKLDHSLYAQFACYKFTRKLTNGARLVFLRKYCLLITVLFSHFS